MTGEELYELYWDAQSRRSVGVDTWEEMDATEQSVWDEIASKVQLVKED